MSDELGWKTRLRETLEARGLTYRELADRAGLKSATHVSSLLSKGGPRSPNGDTLVQIARALGVSSDWLMTGEEAPDTPNAPSAVVVRNEMPPEGWKKFGELPGWTEAETGARRLYRDLLPDFAWEAAAAMAGARWPTEITPQTVYRFAKAWFDQASDEEVIGRERAEIERQIAAYRATDEAKRRGHG